MLKMQEKMEKMLNSSDSCFYDIENDVFHIYYSKPSNINNLYVRQEQEDVYSIIDFSSSRVVEMIFFDYYKNNKDYYDNILV